MGLTNAEKQRRHRERLKNKGLVRIEAWTTPERAEAIKRILQGLPVAFKGEAGAVTGNRREARAHPLSGEASPAPPEQPVGQGDHPARYIPTGEAPQAPQRPPEGEKRTVLKAPFAKVAKPALKKGEKPGQWRVLIEGEEIGTVQKEHHAAFAGAPAFDRWKPRRKGSIFDALSERTYKTRAQAVQALVRDYGPGG